MRVWASMGRESAVEECSAVCTYVPQEMYTADAHTDSRDSSSTQQFSGGHPEVHPPFECQGKTLLPPEDINNVFSGGDFSVDLPADTDIGFLDEMFYGVACDEHVGKDATVATGQFSGSDSSTVNPPPRERPPLGSKLISPLTVPKAPVWRMLYVDPYVENPKREAGMLEKAASQALPHRCVFDVATDIVEALADVRQDTMLLYRGVLINECLVRQGDTARAKQTANSIGGKELSQFLVLAGMKEARIVLLVAGDVDSYAEIATAHGLHAVLRKPFTSDGLCDILRGLFTTPRPPRKATPAKPKSVETSPPHEGQQQFSGKVIQTLAAPLLPPSRSTAELSSSPAPKLGLSGGVTIVAPFVRPEVLGFAVLPPQLLSRFQLVNDIIRSGQLPRRKYTKIAPRGEDGNTGSEESNNAPAKSCAIAAVTTPGVGLDQVSQASSVSLGEAGRTYSS